MATQLELLRAENARAHKTGDPAVIGDVKRRMTVAQLADDIQRKLASVPPLTADETDFLVSLLRGGAR